MEESKITERLQKGATAVALVAGLFVLHHTYNNYKLIKVEDNLQKAQEVYGKHVNVSDNDTKFWKIESAIPTEGCYRLVNSKTNEKMEVLKGGHCTILDLDPDFNSGLTKIVEYGESGEMSMTYLNYLGTSKTSSDGEGVKSNWGIKWTSDPHIINKLDWPVNPQKIFREREAILESKIREAYRKTI